MGQIASNTPPNTPVTSDLRPPTCPLPLAPITPAFAPTPDLWVQLRDLPSDYSSDQALLLCEEPGDRWAAWVPDHGEIHLHRSQFIRGD
jgi:hypothetical protein